jgi:hypothetical protein
VQLGASQVPRGPVIAADSFAQMLTHSFLHNVQPLKSGNALGEGRSQNHFWREVVQVATTCNSEQKVGERSLSAGEQEVQDLAKLPEVEEPGKLQSGAIFERALSVISDKNFPEKRQDLLDKAIDKWFCIIRVNLLGSAAGREIIGHGNLAEQKAGAYNIIEAIIGIRSRTTAIARANSLLKFFRWGASATESDGAPVSEQDAWMYLSHLRSSGASMRPAPTLVRHRFLLQMPPI